MKVATVYVVALDDDDALKDALSDGERWMRDCFCETEASIDGEVEEVDLEEVGDVVPYLTDAAKEEQEHYFSSDTATVSQWMRAIEDYAPVPNGTTLPLPLPYADGTVERVESVMMLSDVPCG